MSEAAEFNFHADPEAASIVLRLTRCPTYIASWELCLKYTFINMKWRSEVGQFFMDKYYIIFAKKQTFMQYFFINKPLLKLINVSLLKLSKIAEFL